MSSVAPTLYSHIVWWARAEEAVHGGKGSETLLRGRNPAVSKARFTRESGEEVVEDVASRRKDGRDEGNTSCFLLPTRAAISVLRFCCVRLPLLRKSRRTI